MSPHEKDENLDQGVIDSFGHEWATFDYGETETHSVRLNQDIEYTGYEIIDLYHSGWENNEGGDGIISFDFEERTVLITHNQNYEGDFHEHLGEFKLV